MFKKWKANRKLKKFRRDNPKQNIDDNGNVIIDESHLVCFVNEEYPEDHQMIALIDATSKWFYSYGSTQDTLRWANRRSDPIIYKAGDCYDLERIGQQCGIVSDKISTSFFCGRACCYLHWTSVALQIR